MVIRIGQKGMTGRVKVYRFRLYDIASDEFRISNRMATAPRIRRLHGELLRRTEIEIDRRELDADGMTGIGFAGVDRDHRIQ
jgi:hypothetical protein